MSLYALVSILRFAIDSVLFFAVCWLPPLLLGSNSSMKAQYGWLMVAFGRELARGVPYALSYLLLGRLQDGETRGDEARAGLLSYLYVRNSALQ